MSAIGRSSPLDAAVQHATAWIDLLQQHVAEMKLQLPSARRILAVGIADLALNLRPEHEPLDTPYVIAAVSSGVTAIRSCSAQKQSLPLDSTSSSPEAMSF